MTAPIWPWADSHLNSDWPWLRNVSTSATLAKREDYLSVSLVSREHVLTAAQLFQWRKAYLEGSLVAVCANETVVPASEFQEAMKRIKQLEGALGRKTLENEILKEAVDFAKAKKWIARSLVLPGNEQ
jgi:transposase